MTTTNTHRHRNETSAMRNGSTVCNDKADEPRRRGQRGGHIWINLFGRDWVVKRSKPTKLGIIGTVLGILGVMSLAWASIEHYRPDLMGVMLIVIGAILVCYKRLESKNLAADEIFNVGRERGEADGYTMGFRDGFEEGEKARPRPVVVPFPTQKCSDCGASAGKQFVGSVADRG